MRISSVILCLVPVFRAGRKNKNNKSQSLRSSLESKDPDIAAILPEPNAQSLTDNFVSPPPAATPALTDPPVELIESPPTASLSDVLVPAGTAASDDASVLPEPAGTAVSSRSQESIDVAAALHLDDELLVDGTVPGIESLMVSESEPGLSSRVSSSGSLVSLAFSDDSEGVLEGGAQLLAIDASVRLGAGEGERPEREPTALLEEIVVVSCEGHFGRPSFPEAKVYKAAASAVVIPDYLNMRSSGEDDVSWEEEFEEIEAASKVVFQVMRSSSVTEGISEWVVRATLAVRGGVEAGMEAVRRNPEVANVGKVVKRNFPGVVDAIAGLELPVEEIKAKLRVCAEVTLPISAEVGRAVSRAGLTGVVLALEGVQGGLRAINTGVGVVRDKLEEFSNV